ncbi:alpha/beta fold hydrolase [Kibdelosporangium aridum]|uniref:alpha/beta fold hydrolase n=1 Tax=Kibdelosporangium aridum TaxID=2030 RepID=UPI00052593DC
MINRRQFSTGSAAVLATAAIAGCSSSDTGPAAPAPVPSKNNSFGPLKQVQAGVLNIGYAEAGPADGPVVILLHGWPYDIHAFVDVAPALVAKGFRVIVPYLRGYGTTTFLKGDTVRNAQQTTFASDIIAMMDALKIDKAIFGAFDWGARTACVIAALWPQRCKALVSDGGYLITNLKANLQPLPPATELGWWYQYYFTTERGVMGYTKNKREFNRLIWQTASPKWRFDDATYERSATAFDNPDHVAIVIHNYRWRLSLAPGEPAYDALEQKLAEAPAITVPTITIASDFEGAAADGMAYRNKFTAKYEHRVLNGIGHNVPQEAPEEFAKAIIDVDRF